MDEPKLFLDFSGLEIVYLTDAVANDDIAKGLPDRDAYVPLARELLLLLGSAYCECIFIDHVAPGQFRLSLTEEQVWLMRSKVRTADLDMTGQNIGIGLCKKLYGVLLEFNSGLPHLDVVDFDTSWSKDANDQLYAGGYLG